MHDHNSPLASGGPTCDCPPALAADGAEQHDDACPIFEVSRSRRDRDRADLAGRPPGWRIVRPLDVTEADDAADATGLPAPTSRRAQRRWKVEVTRRRVGDMDALVRTFRHNGRKLGVIADEIADPAGAR